MQIEAIWLISTIVNNELSLISNNFFLFDMQ